MSGTMDFGRVLGLVVKERQPAVISGRVGHSAQWTVTFFGCVCRVGEAIDDQDAARCSPGRPPFPPLHIVGDVGWGRVQ